MLARCCLWEARNTKKEGKVGCPGLAEEVKPEAKRHERWLNRDRLGHAEVRRARASIAAQANPENKKESNEITYEGANRSENEN